MMTFQLHLQSWGRARGHTEQDLENTGVEGMVEFGSSTKSVASYGRCDRAHCHGMASGCFSILQPFPPSGIPYMLQTFDVKNWNSLFGVLEQMFISLHQNFQ